VLNLAGQLRLLGVRVRPLHHIVVLRADDRQAVKVVFPRQRLHIGDMPRSKFWSQFDDHSSAAKFQVKGILRVKRSPIAGLGRCQHFGHGWTVALWLIRGRHKQAAAD